MSCMNWKHITRFRGQRVNSTEYGAPSGHFLRNTLQLSLNTDPPTFNCFLFFFLIFFPCPYLIYLFYPLFLDSFFLPRLGCIVFIIVIISVWLSIIWIQFIYNLEYVFRCQLLCMCLSGQNDVLWYRWVFLRTKKEIKILPCTNHVLFTIYNQEEERSGKSHWSCFP